MKMKNFFNHILKFAPLKSQIQGLWSAAESDGL